MLKTLWTIVTKREAYLRAYSSFISPCVGERHYPRIEKQLDPPSIKIGPGRPRKNRRKDPHEDPKRSGRLTKHGIEMSYTVCKLDQHTKGSVQVKIGLWNLPLKDLEVD